MESMDRRGFLKKSAAVTAGLAVGAPSFKKVYAKESANDTINIAVVGIRSRGSAHYKSFAKMKNVNVAAICDIDENQFPKALDNLKKDGQKNVKTYTDIRK